MAFVSVAFAWKSAMRILLIVAVLAAFPAVSWAEEYVYHGPWKTTNRKLDGEMTCIVTPLWNNAWRGRFYGVWQGVPMDYTVTFTGPVNALHGTANIDGAEYEWKGWITKQEFRANFGGDRYSGWFDLKRLPAKPSVTRRPDAHPFQPPSAS
jgi:hypothetical protein